MMPPLILQLVQILGVQMDYANLRLFAVIILMTVVMEVMRLAVVRCVS